MIIDPFALYADDEEDLPPEFLRFGIEFPDGARVSNLNSPWLTSPDATEPLHGLDAHSGSGSDTVYEQEFRAWPVPDHGKLAFVCECPAHGIPESRLEIDTQLIGDAATRARPVWPDATGSRSHLSRSAAIRVLCHLPASPSEPSQPLDDPAS